MRCMLPQVGRARGLSISLSSVPGGPCDAAGGSAGQVFTDIAFEPAGPGLIHLRERHAFVASASGADVCPRLAPETDRHAV
jgi:hypothetical protein